MEFPHLVKIDKQYRKRGVQVIAVPLERERPAAAQWKKDFKASFPFVYDPQMKIMESYGIEGIPANIVIDRNGKVVKVIEGLDAAGLDAAVKRVARK